nr:PREDICTED: histone H4-like [Opisthocomus hoazin]
MLLVKIGVDKGVGENSTRCHQNALKDNIQNITKPPPHHLSCMLGVKHILGIICRNSHGLERSFQTMLRVSVTSTQHTKWKIVTAVVCAMKCQGGALYRSGG